VGLGAHQDRTCTGVGSQAVGNANEGSVRWSPEPVRWSMRCVESRQRYCGGGRAGEWPEVAVHGEIPTEEAEDGEPVVLAQMMGRCTRLLSRGALGSRHVGRGG
jgi:hypothetical protein